jgi:hypothetical protein
VIAKFGIDPPSAPAIAIDPVGGAVQVSPPASSFCSAMAHATVGETSTDADMSGGGTALAHGPSLHPAAHAASARA